MLGSSEFLTNKEYESINLNNYYFDETAMKYFMKFLDSRIEKEVFSCERFLLALLSMKRVRNIFDEYREGSSRLVIQAMEDYIKDHVACSDSEYSLSNEFKFTLWAADRRAKWQSKHGNREVAIYDLMVALYIGDSYASKIIRQYIPDDAAYEELLTLNVDGI